MKFDQYINTSRHLAVVDIEATCGKTVTAENQEIIELGCVIIDLKKCEIVGEFETTVRPVIVPDLTPFCKDLTGITQGEVLNSPTFKGAWGYFKTFIGKFENPTRLAGWGDFDYRIIRDECERNNVSNIFDRYLNLKDSYGKLTQNKKKGLMAAAKHYNIKVEGQHHRALHDARMAGEVTLRLLKVER